MTRSAWIEGFEGLYKIHDDGRVEKFKSRFLKTMPNGHGYESVKVSDAKGFRTRRTIHSLVAKNFVPGYKPGLQVNHKNGNKLDNRVENLEWVTREENLRHAKENGLYVRKSKK